MGRGTWSWIVPDGLWAIAEPLIPSSKVRPQGERKQEAPPPAIEGPVKPQPGEHHLRREQSATGSHAHRGRREDPSVREGVRVAASRFFTI
jgi:hypothetical protein